MLAATPAGVSMKASRLVRASVPTMPPSSRPLLPISETGSTKKTSTMMSGRYCVALDCPKRK